MGFSDAPTREFRFESPDGDLEVIIDQLAESPDDPALLAELRRATTERARRLAREMQGQAEELSRGLNAERIAELERIRDEAQRRFDQVMRDTRNQFVELQNGRLIVRSADEAADRLDALRREVERRGPEVQEQLDERLRAMEERLESVERRLTERMERLAALLERVAERAEREE
jgi:type I site-specific restriction endonuclease